MLVDDDQQFLDLNEAMLERVSKQFEIRATTDQEEVVNEVESGWADAVVSDYDMPGRNGVELLEDIRDIDSELPYILFTGRGSEEVAAEAMNADVTDYFQKGSGNEVYTEIATSVTDEVEDYRRLHTADILTDLVDYHNEPVIVIDNKQNITYANEALAKVTDKEVQNLIGEDISAVNVPEVEGELSENVYDETLSQGSNIVRDIWEDEDKTYHLNLTSVSGYNGTVVGTTTST
ncbi:MAG: response regulator [Candidatus Nanosalina sp. J07AB43]|nr:MAG: response regulator [Candidatus Nanosalina sp. J07AB43]